MPNISIRGRPYILTLLGLLALLLTGLHRPTADPTKFQWPGLLPSRPAQSQADVDTSHVFPSPNLAREQERRYAHLRKPHVPGPKSRLPSESTNGKYLFVTLTQNIEGKLPDMLNAIVVLVKFLGPERVRFSIYEGPSHDQTPNVLQEVLIPTLRSLGVPDEDVTIKTDRPKVDFTMVNRIQALAVLRNEALSPLWKQPGWAETTAAVVYFNDVYLRARDVLELLHQHVRAGEKTGVETGITTGVDWWKRNPEYYYDIWVARTMEGDIFYPIDPPAWTPSNEFLKSSPTSRKAYDELKPFQAFSSWAGMAVLAATPFAPPHGVRFRRGRKEECAASECELICRDFWSMGWGRIQVVPSVQLAYDKDVALDIVQTVSKQMEDKGWYQETPPQDQDVYIEQWIEE